jgi:hypothetical protein
MNVLVGCEYSGIVRDAFIRARTYGGWADAMAAQWGADRILLTESSTQGNIRE